MSQNALNGCWRLFWLSAALAFTLSSCTSSFTGGGNKKGKTEKQDQGKEEGKGTSGNQGTIASEGSNAQQAPEGSSSTSVQPSTNPEGNPDFPMPKPEVVTPPPPPPIQAQGGHSIHFPVIGIINMDSQYQISNEGYRVSIEQGGKVLAQAPLNLRSFIDGESADMQGSAYGKPFMTNSQASYVSPEAGALTTKQRAKINICMPEDRNAPWDQPIRCQDLNRFVGHSNGSNTFVNLDADVQSNNGKLVVSAIYNSRSHGGCGTAQVPCASVMHPTFNYAAASGDFMNDNASPLVLDLNKNGQLDLTSAFDKKTKVAFDLTAAGKKIRTGWIAAGDALLAMDVNGNGTIDSGRELFGETSQSLANSAERFENGYLALAQYDANRDGKIDSKDAAFAKLVVWKDSNQDGVSQKAELTSLAKNKITQLNLAFEKLGNEKDRVIVKGNEVRLMGSYVAADGKSYGMADVWFEVRLNRSLAEILGH